MPSKHEVIMAGRIVIYTDGACIPNPGKGGWAYYIPGDGVCESGGHPHTTNNRMELMAICKALASFPEPSHLLIKTDSQYSILIAKKTSKPAKNPDLWILLRELCAYHNVQFEWVKGHSTDIHNNRVDVLANSAAMRQR
jgi:ribonuclease HI